MNETINSVSFYLFYKEKKQLPLTFRSLYFEYEDPTIYQANLSLSPMNETPTFSYKMLSFLQMEDDFVDNTKSDDQPILKDKDSKENYFIDNTSPEYLHSILNLGNGTLLQIGLITKLNEILLNLMLGEKPKNETSQEKLQNEYNIKKQEEKIKLLERNLGSLNILLMNLSHENNQLKGAIENLTTQINSSNLTSLTNLNSKVRSNFSNENITNLKNNSLNNSAFGNVSSISDLLNKEMSKNFTNGMINSIANSSFNFSKNSYQKIILNFTCFKSGVSKIRLHLEPENSNNPFSPVLFLNIYTLILNLFSFLLNGSNIVRIL